MTGLNGLLYICIYTYNDL